jgi:hypothetical protein
MRNEQIAKQAKIKERRKKTKEKKAIGLAKVNAQKAIKTVGIEPKAGNTSGIDVTNHAPKRPKAASRDSPGGTKNVHQPSVQVQAKGRRIPTDAGRNNRKETTKAPERSKRGGRMGEQTTPAH